MKTITVSKIKLDSLVKLRDAGYDVILKQITIIPNNSEESYCYKEDVKKYKDKYKYEVTVSQQKAIDACKVNHVKDNKKGKK
jgi:hypothetical protein